MILPEDLAPQNGICGIIGVGKFGSVLCEEARKRGWEVLLCDPPRAAAESESVMNDLREAWGNGMGGCCSTTELFEEDVFLPQEYLLRKAGLILIAVPENIRLVNAEFLAELRKDCVVLNYSAPVSSEDSRIRNCRGVMP